MHGGGTARIHSQVMNWNQPPRCHVYCLGSSMVRHCSRAGATSTGGQHSATARGVPWAPIGDAAAEARGHSRAACDIDGLG